MAIKDKEAASTKHKTTTAQNEQVTEITKLKEQISKLQVQLEKSSSKGSGAGQGGGADDAMRDKLISTTVNVVTV